MTPEEGNAALRARIEALEFRVQELEALMSPEAFGQIPVHLTKREINVLGALLLAPAGAIVTRERMFFAIWGDADRDMKIIDVTICRLRKTLLPHGVWIENVWGQGFFIAKGREVVERWRSPSAQAA